MQFRNHTVVVADGAAVDLTPRARAVIAALVAHHPHPVDVERVVDLVWGATPPPTAVASIRNQVSRVRRRLPGLIDTTSQGYRLGAAVSVVPGSAGPVRPLDDLLVSPAAEPHRRRLTGLVLAANDDRLEQELGSGVTDELIGRLWAATTDEPHRERRWQLLARALAATGARREALDACQLARRTLADVGLQAGHDLRDLERRILDDDPALRAPSAAAVAASASTVVGIGSLVDAAVGVLDGPEARQPLVVVGAAGSGKTTFAEQLAPALGRRGVRVHVGRCTSSPSLPLEPFAEILAQLHERDPAGFDANPYRADLAVLFPSLPEPAADASSGFDAAARAVGREALLQRLVDTLTSLAVPTLLVIEDLHWASPTTLAVLADVARTAGNGNTALVVTTRPPAADLVGAQTIELPPWSLDVVTEFTDRYTDGIDPAWATALATWVHAQTGGLALFVRELTTFALAHTDQRAPFRPPDTVPDAVLGALAQRLALVADRRALDAAAVLGTEFDPDDVRHVVPTAEHTLEQACAHEIVVPVGERRMAFCHELFRRVVLDQIAPGRRVELHDAFAELLARHARVARLGELAQHAAVAAALDPERAVIALTAAGELRAEHVAWEEAADLFGQALAIVATTEGHTERWRRIAVRAGTCRVSAGLPGGVDLLAETARSALDVGDEPAVGDALTELCRLGPTSDVGPIPDEFNALFASAIATVTVPRVRAQVFGAAAMLYSVADPPLGRDHFDRSIELAHRAEAIDVLVGVLPLAVVCIAGPNDQERRERIADELAGYVAAGGDALVEWGEAHLRMSNQIQRGDPALRDTLARLTHLSGLIGSRGRGLELTFWRSAVALIDGDLPAAERIADELLGFLGSIAESRVTALYGGALLGARVAAGRAGELLGPLRDFAATQPTVGAWQAAVAFAATAAGEHAEAGHALDRALADDGAALNADTTYSAALMLGGRAAAVVGTDTHRAWLIERLLPLSGRWSFSGVGTFGPLDLALAELLAATGDPARARGFARRAEAQAGELRAPLFAAQAAAVTATLR